MQAETLVKLVEAGVLNDGAIVLVVLYLRARIDAAGAAARDFAEKQADKLLAVFERTMTQAFRSIVAAAHAELSSVAMPTVDRSELEESDDA